MTAAGSEEREVWRASEGDRHSYVFHNDILPFIKLGEQEREREGKREREDKHNSNCCERILLNQPLFDRPLIRHRFKDAKGK